MSIGLHPDLLTDFHNALVNNNERWVADDTLSGMTLCEEGFVLDYLM